MILTCPSCSARFLTPDAAIGKAGRTVRCGKCRYQWHAKLPAGTPDIDALMRDGSVVTESPKLKPMPAGSNLPAPAARSVPWWMLAAASVLLFVNIGLGLTAFAPRLVGQPASSGVAFSNVHFSKLDAGEKSARYTVEGDIVNTTEGSAAVPRVHITLRSDVGKVLKEWHYAPKGSMVSAEKPLHFIADDLVFPDDTDIKSTHLRVELGSGLELMVRKL